MRLQVIFRYFVVLLFLACTAALTTSCSENADRSFQGYIEGEYLLVSSPLAGELKQLAVRRGMKVNADALLFSLDQEFEAAAVQEAEQLLLQTEKRLTDLTKGLRPSELEEIKARQAQAKASYELSKSEFARRTKLYEQKVIPKDQLDRTRTELERNEAAVQQLSAQLETAQLGSRTDQVEAAKADVEAARSRLKQAQWKLDQKQQTAPVAALVFDTFYVENEFVPATHPVVSLLPPGNLKIRFFVPETILGSLSPGQKVYVHVDGNSKTFQATINYISPEAEYTPPVIYSRETRSKLVFRIEAEFAPADADSLNPGQPADVFLEAVNA